jgi:hypothetical protein
MPARYARYFIEITGVHAERLQDISEDDCMKEGITAIPQKYNGAFIYDNGLDGEKYNLPCKPTPRLSIIFIARGYGKPTPTFLSTTSN